MAKYKDVTDEVLSQLDPELDHPDHYVANGIEVWDVIEAFNLPYHLADAIAYILRADRKGRPEKDIGKAIRHLKRELQERGRKARNELLKDKTK